jgi:hypothetical protein
MENGMKEVFQDIQKYSVVIEGLINSKLKNTKIIL